MGQHVPRSTPLRATSPPAMPHLRVHKQRRADGTEHTCTEHKSPLQAQVIPAIYAISGLVAVRNHCSRGRIAGSLPSCQQFGMPKCRGRDLHAGSVELGDVFMASRWPYFVHQKPFHGPRRPSVVQKKGLFARYFYERRE